MSPKSFTYQSGSDSGKAHPNTIRPGLTKVKKLGGSYPDNTVTPARGGGRGASVAKRRDGTEKIKTNTRTLQSKGNTKQPSISGSSIPSGVRKNSGLKAPKRVR